MSAGRRVTIPGMEPQPRQQTPTAAYWLNVAAGACVLLGVCVAIVGRTWWPVLVGLIPAAVFAVGAALIAARRSQ